MNNKKIMVVDDDQFLVDLITEKLMKAGYETMSAFDGTTALRKIAEEKPDLVLLDLLMPGVDGVTVLESLKKNPDTKNTPVIILTNLPDDNLMDKIKSEGGAGYLLKNEHNIDAVVDAIKNLV